jgi:hypothetical protein
MAGALRSLRCRKELQLFPHHVLPKNHNICIVSDTIYTLEESQWLCDSRLHINRHARYWPFVRRTSAVLHRNKVSKPAICICITTSVAHQSHRTTCATNWSSIRDRDNYTRLVCASGECRCAPLINWQICLLCYNGFPILFRRDVYTSRDSVYSSASRRRTPYQGGYPALYFSHHLDDSCRLLVCATLVLHHPSTLLPSTTPIPSKLVSSLRITWGCHSLISSPYGQWSQTP